MRLLYMIPVCLLSLTVSAGELVVVVNPQSGVDNLSQTDISNIFLGKAKTFPNGAAASPVNQSDGADRSAFDQKVLRKDTAAVKAYWAKMQFTGKGNPPPDVGGASAVKQAIAGNKSAIGYIDKDGLDSSVKKVATF